MATIEAYTLKSGAKRYRVRYRTAENKSTDSSGHKTMREAKAFAATVEVSKMNGTFVPMAAGRVLVGTVATRWMASAARLKATTKAARESAWSHRVEPRWGAVAVGDVRPSAVREWVADLVADGVGAASIEAALVILRGGLQAAVDDRLLAVNPVAGIKAPRRKHGRRGYLTHQQVNALAHEIGSNAGYRGVGPEAATVVRFLAYTGLRWGEMAALRVQSFDMLRRRVSITDAVAEVQGKVVWDTPKDHERRSVPFPAFLADELAALMTSKGREDIVFAGPKGGVLRASTFRPRTFAPAVARCRDADASFPTITPHDLRHTAASLAISSGANVKSVQNMLGHASAAMTLDTYADLFPDDLDAVASRLDEAARGQVVGEMWVRHR